MKATTAKTMLTTLLGGFCFSVIALLLLITYAPSFAPDAYINMRRTGLIMAVPMISACGLLGSLGWLWMECHNKQEGENDDN